MLQAIRDRITGVVAIFVLGLLAVPFLFFGVDSYIRAVPQDAVATVDGDEISTSEFQTSFANYRRNLREQQGDDYDEIATNQPAIRREHLESLIDQMLLRQHAEELGLAVSESTIFRVIQDIPGFQIGGQFDTEAYRRALQATGRTPRGFEQELREDLLMRIVPSSLSTSTIVTEAEIDRLIALQQETRRATVVELPYDDYIEEVEVSDADIEAFYEANLDSYMTTERLRLRYVELAAEDLTDGLDLSEEELRLRYDAASERYLTPEARRASHILIETSDERDEADAEALARELRERLADGEDFAALAAEYSADQASAEQGGELGLIEPGDMVEAFEDALYDLDAEGDISQPVETRFGFHLIRLDGIRPPEGMSFEEARDEILAEYVERESEAMFIEQSERMIDLVFADETTLQPIAAELDLDIQETDWLTRDGGSGIADHPEVIDAAFSYRLRVEDLISDPIEIERNRMVVVQVGEHEPAEPMALDTVADRIRDRLTRERAAELARERGQEIIDSIADDPSGLEAAAEAAGLSAETLDSIARFDFQHGGDFINELFRLPRPSDAGDLHLLPRGESFAVTRLEAVMSGNPAEASEAERRSARQQLQFSRMGQEMAGLVDYLRDQADIRVVEDRL